MSKSDALKFEYRIKQLPSGKKIIELTEGKDETMNIKKELDKVGKEMQTLTRSLAKLIVDTDRLKKAKAGAVKPKAVKKAPAKKPKGRAPAKSAADTVLGVIGRFKKGVDTATLMQKTGYDQKKVYNIVFKLKKQGKIKNEEKGRYTKA
jgi:predicted Rossmann fold nucleotide-binding protein DprA/Smf involved in DNA uptake